MTDPAIADSYESSPGSSSDDTTFKFYQVAVPNFTFNQTGDQTGVTRTVANAPDSGTSGNSFIRLGSFPDVTKPANGPAGFATSLALANVVGDATLIPGAEPSEDVAPATYHGDPNYLLGFADDTRYRTDTTSWTERQTQTLKLLTKGGWWDHSDGNRISTTVGDKIEIIQGNYKMIVMGRQTDLSPSNLAAKSLIRDVSGGMVEENGPSPTHCIKTIEWTQEEGGTWSVYQNNGAGNVYSSFYGDIGDAFFGPHQESWKGIAPDGFETSEFYKNSLAQRKVEGAVTTGVDPVITDYTWATSITGYTGSTQKWVPSINEYTYANSISSETYADVVSSYSKLGRTLSNTVADAVTNVTTAASINDVQTALEKFTFTAATQWNIAFPLIVELFLGLKWSIGIDYLEFRNRHNVVRAQETAATGVTDRIDGVVNSVTDVRNDLTQTNTNVTDLDNRLTTETTQLSGALTTLDGEAVKIGGTYECLFEEINEGY